MKTVRPLHFASFLFEFRRCEHLDRLLRHHKREVKVTDGHCGLEFLGPIDGRQSHCSSRYPAFSLTEFGCRAANLSGEVRGKSAAGN